MISSITSVSNPKVKELYKKTRESSNQLFVIESVNLIKELCKDEDAFETLLLTQSFLDNNKWVRNQKDVVVVSEIVIEKLAFTKHPPECIGIKKLQIPNFDISNTNYLVLDEIKDPGNLATIIRTAVAFNVKHLFISENSVSLFNDKVLRSTMGTIFDIKVNYYTKLNNVVKELESKGIECIATCLDDKAISLDKYKPQAKNQAIIMGNESHGLSKEFLGTAKHKCYIEINNTNSLNVASATSIMLYQMSLWNK